MTRSPKPASSRIAGNPPILVVVTRAVLLCALLLVPSAMAQEITTPGVHVFRLRFSPTGFMANLFAQTGTSKIVFKKEPRYSGGAVIRGDLGERAGGKRGIGFAVDRDAGKLYVDQNRNLDLTDDPAGVYEQPSFPSSSSNQVFEGISVTAETSATTIPYRLDLMVYSPGGFASATVRSGWEKKIELDSAEYWLGVGDVNVDGVIDRPDAFYLMKADKSERDAVFFTDSSSRLSIPQSLFLNGQCYELSFAFTPAQKNPELAVTFRETSPALGDVAIEGQFVKRLVLTGNSGHTVIVDRPTTSVMIPVDEYVSQSVWLDRDGAPDLTGAFHDRQLTVAQGQAATLRIGGPLRSTVAVKPKGGCLVLDYKILGVGGEEYKPPREANGAPPTFAIYKGGARLASGTFEYG